MIIYLMIVYED